VYLIKYSQKQKMFHAEIIFGGDGYYMLHAYFP